MATEPADESGTAAARPRWPVWLALGTCLLVALVLRVFGAWAYRYTSDPDTGIVALMAKHVAEGGDWPVFFYGQAYMGSLEPLVSALFCRLFGVSGFAVNLGSVAVAMLVLPVLFGWARAAGGRGAALVALALCVMGPHRYFAFQFCPRGGYMTTLLFGLLVMWQGGCIAERLWRRERVPACAFLLLGLSGGVAWWTNVSTVSALLATALTLLLAARGRPPVAGLALGLAGFVVGSLPFWGYNLHHAWASFAMLRDTEAIPWRTGFRCLGQRYVQLMEGAVPGEVQAVLLALPLLLGTLGVGVALTRILRRRDWNPHVTMLLLFLACSLLLFVRSRFATFNTARYLIPWVPAVAVLIGVGLTWLARRAGRVALVLPLVVLLAAQLDGPMDAWRTLRAQPARRDFAEGLESFLQARGITACYGHFIFHVHNFHTRERIRFTGFLEERVGAIARDAELAAQIGVLDNHGKVVEFLADGGGQGQAGHVGSRRVDYGFVPPPAGRVDVSRDALASVVDGDGRSLIEGLTDRNLETEWYATLPRDGARPLTVTFAVPQVVRMVRLWGQDAHGWPRLLGLEYRAPGSDVWTVLRPLRPLTRLFWSGPRLYYDGVGFRVELHLPDVPMAAFRLVGSSGGQPLPDHWAMSELEVYAPAAEPPDQNAALPALRIALSEEGLTRLYSDRWVANQLHRDGPPGLALMLDPQVFPDTSLRAGDRLRLGPDTGLLVLEADASASRAELARHGVEVRERTIGPWVLMTVQRAPARVYAGEAWLPLRWVGFGCRSGGRSDNAADLVVYARAQREAGAAPAQILALLAEAASGSPDALACGEDLVRWLRETLPDAQTDALLAAYEEAMHADIPVRARFLGGCIELVGVNVSTTRVAPGGRLEFDYLWRCSADAAPDRWAVFVHMCQDKKVRFQADYRLLSGLSRRTLSRQSCPVIRRQQQVMEIPADTPPGDYTLRLGLYNNKGRARVAADADVRMRAVYLPATFTVTAP